MTQILVDFRQCNFSNGRHATLVMHWTGADAVTHQSTFSSTKISFLFMF